MDCQKTTQELNDAHEIYSNAFWDSITITKMSPYQMHKAKQAYLDLLNAAREKFEFLKLDSIENLEQLFGELPQIREIIIRKAKAVEAGNYEEAAQLRDQEKKRIMLLMKNHGINDADHFICWDGKIYYKSWNNYLFDS